jgi:hypothetical protein
LQTEGAEDDPASVRGLAYGGEGRPKGAGKQAVLDALADYPDSSAEEIATLAGVTPRYVRGIKAERAKKRGQKKREAKQTAGTEIDLDDPRLTAGPLDVNLDADAYSDLSKMRRGR